MNEDVCVLCVKRPSGNLEEAEGVGDLHTQSIVCFDVMSGLCHLTFRQGYAGTEGSANVLQLGSLSCRPC